jgi:cytoskeleton protein RodZ
MDMGETLRTAREQQGLSLDVISQRTKIGILALRAIEENDIQSLPTGIFLRGFIRAYAREVGLDAEDTVNRYVAQFESHAAPLDNMPVDAPTRESPVEISETQQLEESLREMSIWGVVAVVVLSLGLLAYMTMRSPRVPPAATVARAEAPPAVAPPAAFQSAVPTAPLPPENAVPPPLPVVQSGNTITLTIETVGPCWVEAIVDGQTVINTMMQEGERQSIERGTDVVLRVGDPAVFTFSINGVPGKPIGQPGTASTVHITPDNYKEFIAVPPTP